MIRMKLQSIHEIEDKISTVDMDAIRISCQSSCSSSVAAILIILLSCNAVISMDSNVANEK